jgi:hypothetical protein
MTVDCPLDCEYLQEARRHEKPQPIDASQVPNRDIEVSERFLEEHEPLLAFFGRAVGEAAFASPGANDFDVREALDSLIRTYRTLQSGVYYETLPANPLAAGIYGRVQQALAEYRQHETRQLGVSRTRDGDVLGVLVFLQRVELDRNNGRRRSRAFLDMLRQFSFAETAPSDSSPSSSLILP